MTVRYGVFCCLLFFALGVDQRAFAQNSQPKPDTAAPAESAPAAKSATSDAVPAKANSENGLILNTPLVQEALRLLEERRRAAPEPSPWSVTSVSVEGTADGDQANLQMTLQIQLLAEGKWVQVPLQLTEATLQDQTYEGPGESAPPAAIDPDQGYAWWLKGKGQHVLKFRLTVPLRKDLPGRRLQLTLPKTLVSRLNLRVPVPRLIAKGDEQGRASLVLTPTADGATMIEMIGLGPRIDLTWQPQPDLGAVETVLEARTAITATIDGRTLLLEANQRIVALQGAFKQLQVRMPRSSELLKVEGEYFKERLVDPKDPTQVQVTLKDETPAGPVDLKWTVRLEIPSQAERILIEGFEVAKAKIQTGHLAIRLVGDYRLEGVDGQNQFVQRDNLSTLEKAVPAFPNREDVTSAYSILRQPFQLAFNLQPEKPHITVTPRLFLSLHSDRMELFGEYDIQVFRWGIEELTFAWPGWKNEGWKLDPIGPANQVEETKFDDASEIRVKLIERKVGSAVRPGEGNSTGEPGHFTLLIHATRMLSVDQPSPEFTLPDIPGANLAPTDFVLVLADNLDADLRPLGETATRLQTVSQTDVVPLPKNLTELRRRDFRLDASKARFSVTTTVQEQKINSQTEVELSLEGAELEMRQRITYDVSYKRLSQVLLLVPDQFVGSATYTLEADGKQTPLVGIPTGASEDSRQQTRVALDAPRIGKFDLLIHASLPVTWPMGAIKTSIDVPLVLSIDAPQWTSTRVKALQPRRQQLSVTGSGWTTQAPQNGFATWLATTRQSVISLQCEKSDGTGRQGISVPRRLVQAVYAPGGEIYCQAQYYVAGQAAALRVTFPRGATQATIRWGQERIDGANFKEIPDTGQYQITLPDSATSESEHLLTIAYQLPRQTPVDAGDQRRLAAPEIKSDGTPTQTFWQVQLPLDQHLWTLPAGFTPEFDWRRTGGWWSRIPRHSPEALEQWVGGVSESRIPASLQVSGNRYLFSSLEGASEMGFHTLSAPLIVLIGASLALVLGFVLVNVPSTRHVLTLLWVGFLTTVAALWYSEPVLVLLQPAGLGLVLALLASVAQRRLRRSRVQPVLTLASPSDILTATSSQNEVIPPAFISEDPTQSHPPAYPMTEAGVGL